jgi:SAM-dependent methyltransferase
MSAIPSCRSCQSPHLESVLNLGRTPLANGLLTKEQLDQPVITYPLELVWCPKCTLLQLTENVPAEQLFAHYFYLSSFSETFLKHCKTLADRLINECKLTSDSLVIDIASNDGYLLQFYKEKNIPVLGIEPASNISAIALKKGINTLGVFFTDAVARQIAREGTQADVIHAHNVMPHVEDQRDFAAGIATLLKPDGIAVIEFAYAIDTMDHTEFDQIYHEHKCYFSLTAFKALCAQFGLDVIRVERIAIHGGSLRVFLAHTGRFQPDETVSALLQEEKTWGVDTPAPYKKFADSTTKFKSELMKLLTDLKAQGKRIAVYGASAKGSTLMNYVGITTDIIEYIVDRSTIKQGFYAPGTHLLIEPVEKLLSDKPDYVLLLTWNFAEEILRQQEAYRDQGGKFIVPIPEIRIV